MATVAMKNSLLTGRTLNRSWFMVGGRLPPPDLREEERARKRELRVGSWGVGGRRESIAQCRYHVEMYDYNETNSKTNSYNNRANKEKTNKT